MVNDKNSEHVDLMRNVKIYGDKSTKLENAKVCDH